MWPRPGVAALLVAFLAYGGRAQTLGDNSKPFWASSRFEIRAKPHKCSLSIQIECLAKVIREESNEDLHSMVNRASGRLRVHPEYVSPNLDLTSGTELLVDDVSTRITSHVRIEYVRENRPIGKNLTVTPYSNHGEEFIVAFDPWGTKAYAQPPPSKVYPPVGKGRILLPLKLGLHSILYYPPTSARAPVFNWYKPNFNRTEFLRIRLMSRKYWTMLNYPDRGIKAIGAKQLASSHVLSPKRTLAMVPFNVTGDQVEYLTRSRSAGYSNVEMHTHFFPAGFKEEPREYEHDTIIVVFGGRYRAIPDNVTFGKRSVAFVPSGTLHGLQAINAGISHHLVIELHK